MFSKATALLALAASASAHMILEYPVPYGKATLNSSPLAVGDWPCKQRAGGYEVSEMNQWNAGETKTISFIGSAVHGGGSCQFSLTTDAEPDESSQWKVIHSVVGGCPSNVTGNIEPENPDGHGAGTFPVEMPESIPDGQYTFAWTWLNKLGNREFYMNCAPIKVGTGETASTESVSTALGHLPDMFVANLPDTSCSTTEGEDFNYPDAGTSVADGNSANLGAQLNGAGCASMTKMGAGKGQLGSPTGGASASAPAATQPAATSAAPAYSAAPVSSAAPAYSAAPVASEPAYSAAPVASSSGVPGLFAPGASSAPAATAPAATKPAASAAPVASAAPIASAAPVAPSTPASTDCTPCTNDGAVVCIGSDSFGLCNRGCAVAQKLAAGMACTDGSIVAATKRSFPRAHLHKRHGAGLRLL